MDQEFTVVGMSCGHCERALTPAVQRIDPTALVTINRSAQEVRVNSEQPRQAIARAMAEEGYEVS
jgi:copper chaperone